MTEQTNRAHWDLDRRVQHERELQQKRQVWEHRQREKREQEKRAAKQAELQSYVRDRGRARSDATGSAPSVSVVQRWTEEFMDTKQLESQAERAERLARAEESYDF
jgi:hypothetical protein